MTAFRACARGLRGLWMRLAAAAAAAVVVGNGAAPAFAAEPAVEAEPAPLVLDEAKMMTKLAGIAADPTRLEARVGYRGYGYGYGGYPFAVGLSPYRPYGYGSYYSFRPYPRAWAYPNFYPGYGSFYSTPYYSAAYYAPTFAPAVYAAPRYYPAPVVAPVGVYYRGYGGCCHW